MKALDQLCRAALSSPPSQPAIEFEQHWVSWGEMRLLADQLATLIDSSGSGQHPQVAFVARNRPAAIAAFLGMLEKGCSVRMVYPFQSAQAIAQELERINPAVVIADAEDYAESIIKSLKSIGAVAIALQDMETFIYAGLNTAPQARNNPGPPSVEILTSGTTGAPKAFSLGYDMIARHIVGPTELSADIRGAQAHKQVASTSPAGKRTPVVEAPTF